MHPILSGLGIPSEVQAFFDVVDELSFDYGDSQEHYGEGFHKVPTTTNLWFAGDLSASHVIVTYCAMEAIAFLTINRQRYPRLEQLAFIAIGCRLYDQQVEWIRRHFPNRKFTLIFGKDLLGHLTAIKLAAGIRNIPVQIFHKDEQIIVIAGNRQLILEREQVSLHAFQEAFGLRPRLRTGTPRLYSTYLEQLKGGAQYP